MATVASSEQRASADVIVKDPLANSLIPELIEERRREADGTTSRTVLNKYVRGRMLGKVDPVIKILQHILTFVLVT